MAKKVPAPGDLVIIQNPDIIESFVLREPRPGEIIYGILVDLIEESPDHPADDTWVVLINDQLYKMLRWEFVHVHAKV